MHRGYIKLWRKLLDSGLMQNAEVFTFFAWSLMKASHKPYKHLVGTQMVELEPGQFVTGIHAAAKELKTTPRKIRTALVTLENLQILTRKATNKFSIVSIVNWHIYQPEETENDKQNDKQATSKRQAGDNKQEGRELKNKRTKEPKPSLSSGDAPRFTAQDLFDLWNQNKAEMQPNAVKLTPSRRTHANARFKEEPSREYWIGIIDTLANSPFCCGDNDRGWKADFDFMLKPNTHVKATEGTYNHQQPTHTTPKATRSSGVMAALELAEELEHGTSRSGEDGSSDNGAVSKLDRRLITS